MRTQTKVGTHPSADHTLRMLSILSTAQYACVDGASRVSHNAAVAAWQPWETMDPSGHCCSCHRSRRSTMYMTSGSSSVRVATSVAGDAWQDVDGA